MKRRKKTGGYRLKQADAVKRILIYVFTDCYFGLRVELRKAIDASARSRNDLKYSMLRKDSDLSLMLYEQPILPTMSEPKAGFHVAGATNASTSSGPVLNIRVIVEFLVRTAKAKSRRIFASGRSFVRRALQSALARSKASRLTG